MCGNNGVSAAGIGKCFEATMQRWISSGQAPSIRFGGIGLARVNIKRRMAHGAQSQLTPTLPIQILSSSPLGSSQTPSPGTTRADDAVKLARSAYRIAPRAPIRMIAVSLTPVGLHSMALTTLLSWCAGELLGVGRMRSLATRCRDRTPRTSGLDPGRSCPPAEWTSSSNFTQPLLWR